MTSAIKQTALLYTREKTFRALVIVFFLSILFTCIPGILWKMSLSRTFVMTFQSMMAMLGLWMTFLWGIILKRQFASHRANLIPHYRSCHLTAFVMIFGLISAAGLGWVLCLAKYFHISVDDQLAVIAAALLISVMSLIFGYLSVLWLSCIGFLIFCLFSDSIYMIAGQAIGFTLTNILTIVATLFIVKFWIIRLQQIREHHWEYGYCLTWSHKPSSGKNDENWTLTAQILTTLRQTIGIKDTIRIPLPYAQTKGLWARALHWEILKWNNYHLMIIYLFLFLPVYIIYINWIPSHFASYLSGHLKYFLLAVYPVVISVGICQKHLACWGYEMTRPVKRENFIREKGIGMLMEIALYWLIAVVFVMVIPYGVLDIQSLFTLRFWVEIGLTATYALMVFGWVACLHGTSSIRIVFQLLALAGLSGYHFFSLSSLSTAHVGIAALLWAFMGILLCNRAYHQWARSEIL